MDLEDTISRDVSQSPPGKACRIPFIWGPQESHIHRDGKNDGCWALGEADRKSVFNGDGALVWEDAVLEADDCTTVCMCLTPLSCPLAHG